MTFEFLLLLSLTLAHTFCLEAEFKCFFYFDREFVRYNLTDLRLEPGTEHVALEYSLEGKLGQIFVNICEGVAFPEKCSRKNGNCAPPLTPRTSPRDLRLARRKRLSGARPLSHRGQQLRAFGPQKERPRFSAGSKARGGAFFPRRNRVRRG